MGTLHKRFVATEMAADGLREIVDFVAAYQVTKASTSLEDRSSDNEWAQAGALETIKTSGISDIYGRWVSRTVNGVTQQAGSRDWHQPKGDFADGIEVGATAWQYVLEAAHASPFEKWSIDLKSEYSTVELFVACDTFDPAELFGPIAEIIERHRIEPPNTSEGLGIFIGHGGGSQWKSLEMLLNTNEFKTTAWESEERAGYPTLETVNSMIRRSSAAVIVMSAADQLADGTWNARQNVVHEIGLSQGILGISSTIIMLEDEVNEFSNIAGLTQIRFPKNDILAKQNEVLSALRLRRDARGGARPSSGL